MCEGHGCEIPHRVTCPLRREKAHEAGDQQYIKAVPWRTRFHAKQVSVEEVEKAQCIKCRFYKFNLNPIWTTSHTITKHYF